MKPNSPPAAVTEFLRSLFPLRSESVERLDEGLESQAFRFDDGHDAFVLRIGSSLRGFEKDRWAFTAVEGRLPVPRVVALGRFDADNAYCITEWTPGLTLEDLAPREVEAVVDEVREAWSEIATSEVDAIAGFGDFEPDGTAPAMSWREVLEGTLEAGTTELGKHEYAAGLPDFRRVLDTYGELIARCPEERGLIHGDFGSNNVLTNDGRIAAVLDWDRSMVGDPLYDIANARFWATHLTCMQLQAEHFDRTLADLPGYEDRVLCYALRIGIEEAGESLAERDREMATWAMARISSCSATTYVEGDRVTADASLDHLLDEAESQPVSGWDFSWLGERASTAPLPWSFEEIVLRHALQSPDLLDMGTGGGEWLTGMPYRPPRTVATESWPPNVSVAEARLQPLGITVVRVESAPDNFDQAPDEGRGRLPFPDESFTLVCSRHESFVATEVARILRRDGIFVTQDSRSKLIVRIWSNSTSGSERPGRLPCDSRHSGSKLSRTTETVHSAVTENSRAPRTGSSRRRGR